MAATLRKISDTEGEPLAHELAKTRKRFAQADKADTGWKTYLRGIMETAISILAALAFIGAIWLLMDLWGRP